MTDSPSKSGADASSCLPAGSKSADLPASTSGAGGQENLMLASLDRPETTGASRQARSRRRDAWTPGQVAQQSPTGPRVDPQHSAVAGHAMDEALFGVTRVLTFAGATTLTSASGFFFERDDRLFLVTSRHVLFDGPSEHAPDRIEIELHTDARDLTQVSTFSILLHRGGLSIWREAHDSGGEVDVATIELERSEMPPDAVLRPFGPAHLAADFEFFAVGDRLAIPGFPLGFFDTVHHLPVVRQASIASSFGIRFQGQGYFLTDARMHRGSSGSPVLGTGGDGNRRCLLGVHSSRMDMATRDAVLDESLGLNCAWYADVLIALTEPAG
jgi:S1-C subfamily serine protease